MSEIEYIKKPKISKVRAIVLDYDGTLTTFRRGWELILYTYVKIALDPLGEKENDEVLEADLVDFVKHAGGTSPRQLMERLQALILKHTGTKESVDYYMSEYSRIFNGEIQKRVSSFNEDSESYVIAGVRELLAFLSEQKTENYVVTGSGTEEVSHELDVLQMSQFFHCVFGTDPLSTGRHKVDSIKSILDQHSLNKDEVLIIGDGSTEARAAKELNLAFIGIASDEHNGGLCEKKRNLLKGISSNAIISDYESFQELWAWLHD
ncbi:MAG: HAD hydrolase-like protein [Lentisphaeraceae bacterium]|nr:HAD hydrolase-like protein [Lentisphaeraceae bacterium]